MLILRPLVRYADFKGRSRRLEYFGFGLAQAVVQVTLFMLVARTMGDGSNVQMATGAILTGIGLVVLIALALLIPNQALLARRLHDSGKSAWWMLLQVPSVVAPLLVIGSVSAAAAHGATGTAAEQAAILSALGSGILINLLSMVGSLVLLVMTLLPGTQGENRFGPDPRGGGWDGGGSPSNGLAGIDEARLEAAFAEAAGARPAYANPVDGLRKSVFDFGFEPEPQSEPQPQPVAAVASAANEDPFAIERASAPVFGRRTVKPA